MRPFCGGLDWVEVMAWPWGRYHFFLAIMRFILTKLSQIRTQQIAISQLTPKDGRREKTETLYDKLDNNHVW